MFYQLLLIHLYRPFLKYTRSTTPIPQHASPRKLCTLAASAISKLLRLYEHSFGFDQICDIAVYITHFACMIHLLNLPEKSAQTDLVHGLRHLEKMAQSWLSARRTLRILDISANKWQVKLPNEAVAVLERTRTRPGSWGSWDLWDQALLPTTSGDCPLLHTACQSVAIPPRISSPGAGSPGRRHVDESAHCPASYVEPMGGRDRRASSIPNSMSGVLQCRGLRASSPLNLGVEKWRGISPGLRKVVYSASMTQYHRSHWCSSQRQPNEYPNEAIFPNNFPQ